MRRAKKVVLSVLIVLPVVSFATDDLGASWKSSAALGMTYKSGNTEKSLYTMTLKGDRSSSHNDWINSLYSEYGKTAGDQTEGQVRGQSDYRHKLGESDFFYGAFAEALHDTIKQIRARVKVGPECGYHFLNTERIKFDVSTGLNAVYERTSAGNDSLGEVRLAANFAWNITEQSSYYLNVEYNATVEDTDDGNGLLITGLKGSVKDNLSMYVELRDEYDNLPDASGLEHNDVTIIAGLAYDF